MNSQCIQLLVVSYAVQFALSGNSNGTCLDDMGCDEMTFSKEICAIADINEKCCSSCYHFCQDQLVCKNHPSISSLCETSEDIRKMCPKSCGLCGSSYYCANRACDWRNHQENVEWGYYSKTNGNCKYCKIKCSQDVNCGAIECGSDYCAWWKRSSCTIRDVFYESDHLTCYKSENCVDSNEEATDINENSCKDYLPSWCGKYDDIGFISSQICCACGGGSEATVDGNWSLWSEWTKCSATCKGGRKSRSRVCDSPPPSGGGKNCSGSSIETRICNTKKCTRDCCNTDNGRLDKNRRTCFDYQSISDCGHYDDEDFESNSLCCKCGGGQACDGCGKSRYTIPHRNSTSAEFNFTNYSNETYPKNINCGNLIRFSEQKTIRLDFIEFDIEDSPSCMYDWIEIYDGGNSSSSLIGGKMCGRNPPTTIFSSSNEILIKFRSDNYIERRGYKIIAEAVDKVKCICESQNGVPGNNGILCNVNGSFDNVSSCNDYQWCTGPATNHSAIIGSAKLCEFEKIYCGNGIYSPSCRFCPLNNDTFLNSWCRGSCFYDEDTNECKEVDTYEMLENVDCIDNNNWFHTLLSAKYSCSSLPNCLGICYHDLRFYTFPALVIRMGWPSKQIHNTVYRKTKLTAFSEDFIRHTERVSCTNKVGNVLKEFRFPTNMIPDELSALMECEKFCGRNDKCWGCMTDRNGSYQWTAISECEHIDQQEDSGLGKVSQKPLCMDIKIRVEKENEEMLNISRRWELGSCSGSNNYERNFTYVKHERCCLIEGQHTLTCYNEKGPYGWGRSSIEIQGKKYCDDFVGFKIRRSIVIHKNLTQETSRIETQDNIGDTENIHHLLRRPPSGCPEGTLDGLATCYCEDHCSWEICRLQTPPYNCLPNKNTAWIWDSFNMFWTAYKIYGYIYVQNKYCGKMTNKNTFSSNLERHTFESCKMACNNDFDCGAFAFKNKDYLNGTTWCMKYSKHDCEISEHDEWNLFIKEIDYDCKRQGCWIKDPYVRGRDVGVYDDTGADCAACQDRCNSDPKCGAVECNGEYCYWWAHGRCINSSSSHFFTFNEEQYKFGYTCYKRGYSRQHDVYCFPYEDRAWINLHEATHACLQDPDCNKFFHRCGNTDFKVCQKHIEVKQSECGSILYTKDRISTAIPFEIVNNSQSEQNESSKEDSNIKRNEKKKFNVVLGDVLENHGPTLLFGIMTTVAVIGFVYLVYSPRKILKEPKLLLSRLTQVIKIGCLLMAVYYTTSTICQYYENLDETFIRMKKYNEDPSEDRYPTFSVCFKGTNFIWYHDYNIFQAYGLNATQFELMLEGQNATRYERDNELRSYKKVLVTPNNGSYEEFEKFHIRLSDILSEARFVTDKTSTNTYKSFRTGQNDSNHMPLQYSYQSADTICFTRNSNDSKDLVRLDDLITFRGSILGHELFNETEIQIFIHYPDQLISSFSKPKYTASFSYFLSTLIGKNGSNFNILEFKISQCKILRKRHDANVPCNKDITNHDRYLQMDYIRNLGCIPIYWKYLNISNDSSLPELDECTSTEKLKKAYQDLKDVSNIQGANDNPCDEMLLLAIDSINDNPNPQPSDISIKFHYTEKIYEEILYDKKYTFENFCNTLGGFWGIFLGFSLMQFPEFFSYILPLIYALKKKMFPGSTKNEKMPGNAQKHEKDEKWAITTLIDNGQENETTLSSALINGNKKGTKDVVHTSKTNNQCYHEKLEDI